MGAMWIEEAPPEELQVQAARLLLLALDARDEELAHLHPAKIGVKLTVLSPKQADYIGVPLNGPYKPDHYRY